MRRLLASAVRPLLTARQFCTKPEKIVASVVFERLPVVAPKTDPVVYAFQEFSFRWRQQYRRKYPDEFLDKSDARGKGDYQIDYEPAPRITANETNNKKSLLRALDKRLYLVLYGNAFGSPSEKPAWHFPEKVYEGEETLRKCAESALQSVLGDLSHTYFVGNAPTGHEVMQPLDKAPDSSHTKFFFKSQVMGTKKLKIGKCEDYVWAKSLLGQFQPHTPSLHQISFSSVIWCRYSIHISKALFGSWFIKVWYWYGSVWCGIVSYNFLKVLGMVLYVFLKFVV